VKKVILALMALCAFTSCSVVMAAKKEGTSIDKVQNCSSRAQYIGAGGEIVHSEQKPNGNLVEIYRFKKEKGSATRAFMHGAMDVMTLGVWEVVGTPIEACADDNGFFSIEVEYDAYGKIVSSRIG